jgi:hypothetical protein
LWQPQEQQKGHKIEKLTSHPKSNMMATLKFLGGKSSPHHRNNNKRRVPSYMEPLPPSKQPPTRHHHNRDHEASIIDELLGLKSSGSTGTGRMEQEEEEEEALLLAMAMMVQSPGYTTNSIAGSSKCSNSSSGTVYSAMSADSEILSPHNRLLRKRMDRNRTKALMNHMDQQAVIAKMFRGDHLNNNSI